MVAGNECSVDQDCPNRQYCYTESSICVDYTNCNRYNRQEAKVYARNPSQCGPCLSGYEAELLGTGEEDNICKKSSAKSSDLEQNGDIKDGTWDTTTVVIAVGVLSVLVVGLITALYKGIKWWRKRKFVQEGMGCEKFIAMKNMGPSAPPPETRSFIDIEQPPPVYSRTYSNNNDYLKDRDLLARANPFASPNWVKPNPQYDDLQQDNDIPDYSNPGEDILSPPLPPPPAPDEDTNPSSWTPEQANVLVLPRPFSQFGVEQRENAVNTAMAEMNCPGIASDEENENLTSNPGTESSAPSQGARATTNSNNNHVWNFTMNLNVLNGDYKT
ncbi:uncharacterized protein LOC107273252 [Cephus cinctus]|uniref:Uncharacterized protein LOC107273252 n=1 Tax=Cephus cinctus TaxID=211228 RepID=A0AAJ7W6G8_CEPCN|nr:uncharacterized protein LOC107273252 [Cephus cinctus]XP_024946340.1 uncharacterized protein LOC107273252 [Cephus cinctus]